MMMTLTYSTVHAFFLMQRYRPSAVGNALLLLRFYAATTLSDDYETECVGAIHSHAPSTAMRARSCGFTGLQPMA